MMSNFELRHELANLKKEQLAIEQELKATQNQIAYDLQHELGEDMKNVISGQKVVKLTKWESFKYKLKYFINLIFKTF